MRIANWFKRKPGGTFFGNLVRSVLPVTNFIPHDDEQGTDVSWSAKIGNLFK